MTHAASAAQPAHSQPPGAVRPERPGLRHVIAWRVSLPFFGGRFYLAFFAGTEQRAPARLAAESQRKSWLHTLASIVIVTGLVSTMLMGTLAAAYLAKSMLGIDLLEDHFFLHGLFFG